MWSCIPPHRPICFSIATALCACTGSPPSPGDPTTENVADVDGGDEGNDESDTHATGGGGSVSDDGTDRGTDPSTASSTDPSGGPGDSAGSDDETTSAGGGAECPDLLSEDFEGVDLGVIPSGWYWGGGGWAVEQYEGGRVLVGTDPNVIMGFGEPEWTDYEVTMRIRYESNEFPTKILTFARFDDTTGVMWAFKNFASSTTFDRALHDTSGPWQVSGGHTLAPGQWNDFRITAEGNHTELWINEQQVISTDDDGTDRGYVGIYLWEPGRIRVDDVDVTCL